MQEIIDATAFAEAALRTVGAHRTVIAGAIEAMLAAMDRESVLSDTIAFDVLHAAARDLNAALGQIDGAAMQLAIARDVQ